MWQYNQQIEPPAPFLDLIVHHPQASSESRTVAAKLDTGADVSAIPQQIAEELALIPVRTIVVEGYDGTKTTIDTYIVIVQIGKTRFRNVEVILIPDDHALLGRDLLNFFYTKLNGPALTLELSLSA